jgi:hypothetical protein
LCAGADDLHGGLKKIFTAITGQFISRICAGLLNQISNKEGKKRG